MNKKRFSIKYDTISTNYPSGRIFDNEKQHTLYMDEVVNLLNWLKNENKELKKENKKLEEEWEFSFRTEMAHHRFAEKELQEKIREQQATIQFLQNEIDELKKDIDIYKYEEKKHSETARKLYEENEQLRKELKGLNRKYIAFSEATDKRLKEMMK